MAEPTSSYLSPDAQLPFCRGCGHSLVVRHLSNALARLQMPPRFVVLTTDIGCVGLSDSLFPYLHTVHTTHGRSTAFATGMALAEAVLEPSGLKPVVLIGDGGAMIGLLHLVHAAQLNVDVTVLLHNNFLFGMTGGQHSATTPLDFVTVTTPTGNFTPPLDYLSVLRSAHAGFLARQYATDRDLDGVIVDALIHPGFAAVEVVELCPAYGSRGNDLTGKKLKELTERQGLDVGRLEPPPVRAGFAELYRQHALVQRSAIAQQEEAASVAQAGLREELRLVVAGSAGERVQSSARLLCRAALAAGLYATQKNDNPVTIGTGHSVSEVCISPRPIEYTGMENPDVVIVVSSDGRNFLETNGIFSRCGENTQLIVDDSLGTPLAKGALIRPPLRKEFGPKGAALAAVGGWLAESGWFPEEAWEAACNTLPEVQRRGALSAWETGQRGKGDGAQAGVVSAD